MPSLNSTILQNCTAKCLSININFKNSQHSQLCQVIPKVSVNKACKIFYSKISTVSLFAEDVVVAVT